MNEAVEEHHRPSVVEEHEATCWGCGLRLVLASYAPVFKCGWCGAITNRNPTSRKADSTCFSFWRCFRDQFFVSILLFFMLFIICAGVWSVYPVVFSRSFSFGVFHCMITAILSVITISSFCLASFRSPGESKAVLWGSYPVVGRGALDNYTYCTYCAKPKCPRAHHCRSCKMCVLDMDHHCPFIGNCVGAGNHRSFIALLISVLVSCFYVVAMTLYAGSYIWPPLSYGPQALSAFDTTTSTLKLFTTAVVRSLMLLSVQGVVLIYLAFASMAVIGGVSALLGQQLYYIYKGNTYVDSLTLQNEQHAEKGCQNLLRFFSCPYSIFRLVLGPAHAAKLQDTSSSKML